MRIRCGVDAWNIDCKKAEEGRGDAWVMMKTENRVLT